MLRVIAENFAAKLPPSPQLTVLEYQSSNNLRQLATSYSKHTSWKKNGHFSDVDIQ
jgi:hypothetical protein